MPVRDPVKKKAIQDRYNKSPKGSDRHARYRATTEGILIEERHYQKKQRGGTSAEQD